MRRETFEAETDVAHLSLRISSLTRWLKKMMINDIWDAYRAVPRNWSLIHRLSRRITGTKLGRKKRSYRSIAAAVLSRQEWIDTLEKPGAEGGTSAIEKTEGQLRQQIEEHN